MVASIVKKLVDLVYACPLMVCEITTKTIITHCFRIKVVLLSFIDDFSEAKDLYVNQTT